MGRPEEHNSDAEILPLPISSGTFEEIRSTWSFPSELLRMMLSTMPLATEFETESHIGTLQLAYLAYVRRYMLSEEANTCAVSGLMLRSARSRDCSFSLALIYNRHTDGVSGLLHGLQEHEAQKLLSSLYNSAEVVQDPLLFPLILYEMKIHFFALLLENRARGLEDLEESTGMRHFNTQSEETEAQRTRRLRQLSFSDITEKLTGIAGTLAFCEMTFESCLEGLAVARAWRANIINQSTKSGTACHWNACASIDRRAAYIESLAAGARAHGRVLEARRAAQVQTVNSPNFDRADKLIINYLHLTDQVGCRSIA